MSTKRIILIAVGLLAVAALIGCGDDDCASCPETFTPLGHARGVLSLAPGTMMPMLQIYSNGAVAPNLDSVKVGDSSVSKEFWNLNASVAYADAHWEVNFFETGDTSTYMYDPGDLATISVWAEGRSSVCRVKILNPMLTATQVTDPTPYADTVSPGESDTLYWLKADDADYYAIMFAWYVVPLDRYIFSYYYSTDTTFVVTGAMQPAETAIEFNVHVTPFNGPDPRTGQSNWSGNLLDGVVYSYGQQSSTTIVIDQLLAASKGISPGATKAMPEVSAEEIVGNVYKKYGR